MKTLSDNSLMRHMWSSPVQQFSLLHSGIISVVELERIKTDVQLYFESFKSNTFGDRHSTSATLSDMFYRHQQAADIKYKQCLFSASGSDSITKVGNSDRIDCRSDRPKLFHDLSIIFYEAVSAYLAENYLTNLVESISNRNKIITSKIFSWTSLHTNGSHHAAHHHVDSMVSGVMYIQVPKFGAGDLVFYDPRGALPPFGKTLRIGPKVGDLILFPGFLVHSVEPTISEEVRISISFNFLGSWESMSDINIAYHTEAPSHM